MNNIFYHLEHLIGIKNNAFLPPLMVDVDTVQGRCNLDCVWCCQSSSITSRPTTYMSKETMDKLGDFSKEWGIKAWRISGNSEPLLNRDIDILLESGYRNDIRMGLVTNGVCLEGIRNLKYLTYLGISLDAADAESWVEFKGGKEEDFYNIIKNVKRIKINCPKLDITLKCLDWCAIISFDKYQFMGEKKQIEFPSNNFWHIDRVSELATSLGCNFRTRDSYNLLGWFSRKFKTCRATPIGGVFAANHEFSLCCDARAKYVLMDDYTKDDWKELPRLWNSEKHKELINTIQVEGCIGCAKSDLNMILKDIVTNDDPQTDFI